MKTLLLALAVAFGIAVVATMHAAPGPMQTVNSLSELSLIPNPLTVASNTFVVTEGTLGDGTSSIWTFVRGATNTPGTNCIVSATMPAAGRFIRNTPGGGVGGTNIFNYTITTNLTVIQNITLAGTNVGSVNPTIDYLPVKSTTNSFRDSLLHETSTNRVTLSSTLSFPYPGHVVTNVDGSTAYFMAGGNLAQVQGNTGVNLVDNIVGGNELRWFGNRVWPVSAGAILGSGNGNTTPNYPFGVVNVSTQYFWGLTRTLNTNYSVLLQYTTTNGVHIMDFQNGGTGAAFNKISIRSNGTEVATITASGAVNGWTDDGTNVVTSRKVVLPSPGPGVVSSILAGTESLIEITTPPNGATQALGNNIFLAGAGNHTMIASNSVNEASNLIGIGTNALLSNTTGYNSVGIGPSALHDNTSGFANIAIGAGALYRNTSGYWNTAVGDNALLNMTTGYWNTAYGDGAAYSISTGFGNTAIGGEPLFYNTTGSNNTAVGKTTLHKNATGSFNTGIGSESLYENLGSENTAIGYQAMIGNVGASAIRGVAVGVSALRPGVGTGNTGVGYFAGAAQTGNYNSAFGYYALGANSSGANNVAVGFYSGIGNLTGSGNVFIGPHSGEYETGSNSFYVDNQDRTNTAGNKASSLMYGVFNANPTNQTLAINAAVTVISFNIGTNTFAINGTNIIVNGVTR